MHCLPWFSRFHIVQVYFSVIFWQNINGSLFVNLHPVPCRISLPGLCDIPFSSLAKQHGMSSVDSVWLHGAACPREAAFFSWCAIEHQKLQTTAILLSYIKYTFPETNSLQLKMDGRKILVSFLGPGLFSLCYAKLWGYTSALALQRPGTALAGL